MSILAISRLFGRSPFAPLQEHMNKVSDCVDQVVEVFEALADGDQHRVKQIAERTSKLEHIADLAKNDIRNHLPKSLFLPVDRGNLLDILTLQDGIADKSENIAVLLTLRETQIPEWIREPFNAFLEKNIAAFRSVHQIIEELDELVETSFGGVEAKKVRQMVERVAILEHEADLLQRTLLKEMFHAEDKLPYTVFHLWTCIFSEVGNLSDLSEKLANRIRMTLELK